MRRIIRTTIVFWSFASFGQAAAAPPLPAAAVAAGYVTNTLDVSSDFSAANTDVQQTYRPGFKWFNWNFFGRTVGPGAVKFNTDGTVTLLGGYSNGTIASAASVARSNSFVGTAFGGGGYFEAELKFDAATVDSRRGWPSWWTMAIEHMVGGASNDQWPGQPPGFEHFIEADIFEYDLAAADRISGYGGAIHDWFGVKSATCKVYCSVTTPYHITRRTADKAIDWNQFHTYGLLWIPAGLTKPGVIAYYFDGKEIGSRVTYQRLDSQTPPVTMGDEWAFGIIDRQHLVLILGSDSGAMTVRSIGVWQRNKSVNLVR